MTFPNRPNYFIMLSHHAADKGDLRGLPQNSTRKVIQLELDDLMGNITPPSSLDSIDTPEDILSMLPDEPIDLSAFIKDIQYSPSAVDESDIILDSDELLLSQLTPEEEVNNEHNSDAYITLSVDSTDDELNNRVQNHDFMPLIRKLQWMSANPSSLFNVLFLVALEAWGYNIQGHDGTMKNTMDLYGSCIRSSLPLESAVRKYQRIHLEEHKDSWEKLLENMDGIDDEDTTEKHIDRAAAVTALYYWRLWQSVAAHSIDAVRRVQRTMSEIQKASKTGFRKRRASSMSPIPESNSTDSMSCNPRCANDEDVPLGSPSANKRPRLARPSYEFMRGWFLAHKANPYPNTAERASIAEKTGLSEQQVRNWFANMRKRHWRPNGAPNKKPRCFADVMMRRHEF